MNSKLKLILKDFIVSGISDGLAVLAYFSMAEILKEEGNNTITILENAIKLGVVLFAASSTASIYKNLIGEKIEERTAKTILAHLANIPITDTIITLVVALVMKIFPPEKTTKEIEESILSTPFFLTLMANYTGRGVAHVVNHARAAEGVQKRVISAVSSIVPTIACNLLYFAKYGKNGADAISEVTALVTANLVSNILGYAQESWEKSKNNEEIQPLI